MNKQPTNPPGINSYTGRPNSAYPKTRMQPLAYVVLFSRALGLKPTPTEFGRCVVKV